MRDTTTDLLSRIESLELELGHLKALALSPPAGTDAVKAPTPSEHIAAEPSSRRDLLRYGAVALTAATAAMAASPVEAADGGAIIIGARNTGTGTTALETTNGDGLQVVSANGQNGVIGGAVGVGVYGFVNAGPAALAGTEGVSFGQTGSAPGVLGIATSPRAPAIRGIHGKGGTAVLADIPSYSTSSAIAMYALNYSTYTGTGPGSGGFAVYGLSAKGHGLVGATAAAGAAAVVGATNGVSGAYAGAFYGPVIVGGNFTVVGGAKSAAVPHPDGSHRRLYCMESPESWFEDFGRGRLACGTAAVRLDTDFAAVVDASDYLVFITGNDGRSDLSVCDRTPEGFRVTSTAGDVEGTFSWRVVAKRKDIAAPRFETVEVPKEPTLPDVPASVHEPAPPPPHIPRMGVRPRRPNGKP